ncbi:hypothetical protein GE061_015581 [Apolygus lucorum]|uniref:Uncharacterized protein n=1 Tax=Apolygus lucorum TaxID=248454 RepID=A0A6A4JJC7_APOLU|nr:hypothetical protein GE061_015581 [Apolygus lucorum]
MMKMGGDEGLSDSEQVDQSKNAYVNGDAISRIPPVPPNQCDNASIGSIEEFDASLPETVTLLRGANGSKLYLIGTAHFSRESQDDVSKVIQTVNPHIVVVELCQSRANILKMDEKTIEEEAKNLSFEKMMNIIKEEGTLQGLMSIILLNVSAQLTKDLGMAPGGEFRRAFIECQKMKTRNPLFHFGDRPIQVTLRRALDVLSWWQRIRLSFSLVFQKPKISREDVEKCKQGDLLESLLKDMGNEFPELGKVFIEERDTYLTYSLQMASNFMFQGPQNEIEPTVAVGIVGIGHMPGIKALWGKVEEHQIPPIMALRDKSKSRGIVRKVIIGSILTYVAIKIVRRFPPNPRIFGFKL